MFRVTLIVICLLVLTTSSKIQAQIHSSHWLFGSKTSIDFTKFNRSLGSTSGMNAPEGSAVISDDSGSLLFYTNGEEIWNRNHVLMQGGAVIRGSKFCTQSSIIVPDPASTKIYYLFTLTGNTGTQPGLYYHVIDMRGDNGNGAVSSKDNFLLATVEEKLTSAFHENGKDSWVYAFHNGRIYSLLISSEGVGMPIKSGDSFAGLDNKKGAMKVSPDGSVLGLARTELINGSPRPFVELYNLNRQTGTVQEKRVIEIIAPTGIAKPAKYLYGLSFTADSKAFYVSTFEPTQSPGVSVMLYKIDKLTGVHLLNSSYARLTGLSPLGGALQLGPDKRVYFLMSNSLSGEVNTSSLLQAFECVIGPPLQFTLPGLDFRGLPNFNDMIFLQPDPSFKALAGDDLVTCSRQDITFQPTFQTGLSYVWTPAVGLNNPNVPKPIFNKLREGDTPEKLEYVLTTHRLNCSQVTTNRDTLKVTLLPQPAQPRINGLQTVCVNDLLSKTYQVDNLSGHSYLWTIEGGEFIGLFNEKSVTVNWHSFSTTHSINVQVTNSFGCSGERTTLPVNVKPIPTPPIVRGSRSVCPSVRGVSYWLDQKNEGWSYHWIASGGIITTSLNADTIKVDWGLTNSSAFVSVVANDNFGCHTIANFPVRILTEIKPELPSGSELICNNKRKSNLYSVLNRPGSVYFWLPSSGEVIAGQGTNKILINWPGPGKYSLHVEETNTTLTDVCFGKSDLLSVRVYQDSSSLSLVALSHTLEDDNTVSIKWQTEYPTFTTLDIEKRKQGLNSWVHFQSVKFDQNQYLDTEPESTRSVFEYRLTAQNACDEKLQPPFHNLILLQSTKSLQEDIILNWNPYKNWTRKVSKYEIYRKVDLEPEFQLFKVLPGDATSFTTSTSEDGFSHTFYVKAYEEASGEVSFSNSVKLEFEHPIVMPNVFTPNGDGINETFDIPKIHLYPDNDILIVNRYGEQVYSKQNYAGEWDGENLASGTYYYRLSVNNGKLNFVGWVVIVR